MAEENTQQESDIQIMLREIPVIWDNINKADLRTKEMLALNWYKFGEKAAEIKNYWHNQHLSFRKNWQINFPDIKMRRVEQAITIATGNISEDKIIKLAKLGFDNIYKFISSLRRCKTEYIDKILATTSIMATIKNFDDSIEEGLHRLHCFDIFVSIMEQLDISKINIEMLWDAILANRSMPKNSVEAIQTLIDEDKNVDDYLQMIIQTGGGEPQPSLDDNIASINVTNSRFIEITKIFVEKNEVPEDFDLNRLTESMNNCSQLLSLKEGKNAAQNISIGNETGSIAGI